MSLALLAFLFFLDKELSDFDKRNYRNACQGDKEPLCATESGESKEVCKERYEVYAQNHTEQNQKTEIEKFVFEDVHFENALFGFAVDRMNNLHEADCEEGHCACHDVAVVPPCADKHN